MRPCDLQTGGPSPLVLGLYRCGEGLQCLPNGPNPGHGIWHFDNILASSMTIFRIMTLDKYASPEFRKRFNHSARLGSLPTARF